MPPFPVAPMGYDWIFDVLKDLKSFATANGLPGLAAKADEAMKVATQEVAALGAAQEKVPPQDGGSTH